MTSSPRGSGRQFTALLAGGDPAQQEDRALGVETGAFCFQALVEPLAGEPEQTRELRFIASKEATSGR